MPGEPGEAPGRVGGRGVGRLTRRAAGRSVAADPNGGEILPDFVRISGRLDAPVQAIPGTGIMV